MTSLNKTSILVQVLTRIIIYGLFMVWLNQLMFWDAGQQGVDMKFMEATYTEWSQQVILLVMAAVFAHCAYHYRDMRCLSIVFSGISLTGLVREYNNFFNEQVFDGAWQSLAFLVILATGFTVWKYRGSFWQDLNHYFGSLSSGFLLAGFLTTFIFSRLFGRTVFWETLMEDDYFRSVKNAAEECVELLGYGLLLIAAVEYFFLARPKKDLST